MDSRKCQTFTATPAKPGVFLFSYNRAELPLRMLRYFTDIRLAGHEGPIQQFLIYIGSAPLTMSDGIQEPDLLDYRYAVVDMHKVNCAGLLVQDNPDALVLAVLCDFGDREPEQSAIPRMPTNVGEPRNGLATSSLGN